MPGEGHPITTTDPTIDQRIAALREFDEWRQDNATTKVFETAVEQYEAFLRGVEREVLKEELEVFLGGLGLDVDQANQALALLGRLS